MIDADETVFGAMVQSLLDNAVTFTPEGGQIWLSVAPRTIPYRHHRGRQWPRRAAAGPDAHSGAVRACRPCADHAKGAGLGLTLVKAFADLHKGSLEIDSELGKGFRATILMPKAS